MYDSTSSGASSAFYEMTTSQTELSSGARRYRAIKEHLFSDLDGEAVVLSLRNGKYYGLNSVGVTIWNNVQESATLAEIEAAVMNEYDVDTETCRHEVSLFLEKMLGEELIETIDDASR